VSSDYVWASLSLSLSLSPPSPDGHSNTQISVYFTTNLAHYDLLQCLPACQCCTGTHCYGICSLPDRSAVRKGVLSPVSENVRAFVTVLVRTVIACDECGQHYLRNVQYQFIVTRLTVREDLITALSVFRTVHLL
jgi:hypothetical protein